MFRIDLAKEEQQEVVKAEKKKEDNDGEVSTTTKTTNSEVTAGSTTEKEKSDEITPNTLLESVTVDGAGDKSVSADSEIKTADLSYQGSEDWELLKRRFNQSDDDEDDDRADPKTKKCLSKYFTYSVSLFFYLRLPVRLQSKTDTAFENLNLITYSNTKKGLAFASRLGIKTDLNATASSE